MPTNLIRLLHLSFPPFAILTNVVTMGFNQVATAVQAKLLRRYNPHSPPAYVINRQNEGRRETRNQSTSSCRGMGKRRGNCYCFATQAHFQRECPKRIADECSALEVLK